MNQLQGQQNYATIGAAQTAAMASGRYSEPMAAVGEIPQGIGDAEGRLGDCFSALASLNVRLQQVLRPSPPSAGENSQRAPSHTEYGGRLRNHCDQLSMLHNGILDILSRLEV